MADQEPNPYPVGEQTTTAPPPADALIPRSVDAGRGLGWIGDGFGYFKRSPGAWIVMVLIAGLIMIALGMIPLLGMLAISVLSPLFVGGMMQACRKQDAGGGAEVGDLFAGFSSHGGPLAIVGLLYLVGLILVSVLAGVLSAVLMGASMGFAGMAGGEGAAMGAMGIGMVLVYLIALAISLPLIMAIWFAPALVVLEEVAPLEAMKLSFRGCLKNIVPFLVYGVISMVISTLAALPLMLGFLVWGPVVVASAYVGYKDIYARA